MSKPFSRFSIKLSVGKCLIPIEPSFKKLFALSLMTSITETSSSVVHDPNWAQYPTLLLVSSNLHLNFSSILVKLFLKNVSHFFSDITYNTVLKTVLIFFKKKWIMHHCWLDHHYVHVHITTRKLLTLELIHDVINSWLLLKTNQARFDVETTMRKEKSFFQ